MAHTPRARATRQTYSSPTQSPPKEPEEDEKTNLLVYRMLLNYPDPDQVPVKAIGEQLGISFQKVGALLGSAKRNPSTYQRLLEVGYSDGQIPEWIP